MFESQFIEIKLYNFCSINIFLEIQKPCEVYEKGLHDKKVTAWAAMSMHGIIGPFFFEIGGETATINSERYVAVLDRFWRSLGETFGQAFLRNQWFQQDGASVHVSGVSLDWIRRHFAERVISRLMCILRFAHSVSARRHFIAECAFLRRGYFEPNTCCCQHDVIRE